MRVYPKLICTQTDYRGLAICDATSQVLLNMNENNNLSHFKLCDITIQRLSLLTYIVFSRVSKFDGVRDVKNAQQLLLNTHKNQRALLFLPHSFHYSQLSKVPLV